MTLPLLLMTALAMADGGTFKPRAFANLSIASDGDVLFDGYWWLDKNRRFDCMNPGDFQLVENVGRLNLACAWADPHLLGCSPELKKCLVWNGRDVTLRDMGSGEERSPIPGLALKPWPGEPVYVEFYQGRIRTSSMLMATQSSPLRAILINLETSTACDAYEFLARRGELTRVSDEVPFCTREMTWVRTETSQTYVKITNQGFHPELDIKNRARTGREALITPVDSPVGCTPKVVYGDHFEFSEGGMLRAGGVSVFGNRMYVGFPDRVSVYALGKGWLSKVGDIQVSTSNGQVQTSEAGVVRMTRSAWDSPWLIEGLSVESKTPTFRYSLPPTEERWVMSPRGSYWAACLEGVVHLRDNARGKSHHLKVNCLDQLTFGLEDRWLMVRQRNGHILKLFLPSLDAIRIEAQPN